eukprot:comp67964_c0_seq1/m.48057 comp67964_c0_seq1/g.48057  ORF comp67964_c0_seq1/g.48057 comp67964_c0_seq1/m.48057 type:complete len:112 (-) comp67964_c0_seq1:2-337(-)
MITQTTGFAPPPYTPTDHPTSLVPITTRKSSKVTCPMCTKHVHTYVALRPTHVFTREIPCDGRTYTDWFGVVTASRAQKETKNSWLWAHHKCPKCGAVLASVPPQSVPYVV